MWLPVTDEYHQGPICTWNSLSCWKRVTGERLLVIRGEPKSMESIIWGMVDWLNHYDWHLSEKWKGTWRKGNPGGLLLFVGTMTGSKLQVEGRGFCFGGNSRVSWIDFGGIVLFLSKFHQPTMNACMHASSIWLFSGSSSLSACTVRVNWWA